MKNTLPSDSNKCQNFLSSNFFYAKIIISNHRQTILSQAIDKNAS